VFDGRTYLKINIKWFVYIIVDASEIG
jgi:hypothetical protein